MRLWERTQKGVQMVESNLFGDGEAYELTMGRWSQLVGDKFIDWLDAPRGLRWLDVGCGNGAFTERIISCSAPAEVVAIDPSKEQLAYASTRPGTKLAKFQLGDAQKLPFANGSFDAAVMALVITFIPDPARAVAEMVRVVRPGGWIATYMWDVPAGGLPSAPFHAAMKSLDIPPATPPNSAATSRSDAMLAMWENAGLKSIDTRVIRILTHYANFDDFWNANTLGIGRLGKALNEMTASVREQVRTRLREQLAIGPDGGVTYEAFANAVKGRKPD
jgi:ubiquinone/menaquinone biosynthesis C-methylase UbiE